MVDKEINEFSEITNAALDDMILIDQGDGVYKHIEVQNLLGALLNTDPQTWSPDHLPIQFGTAGVIGTDHQDATYLAHNTYHASGDWRYIYDGVAMRLKFVDASDDKIRIRTATSGTAGNAITWSDVIIDLDSTVYRTNKTPGSLSGSNSGWALDDNGSIAAAANQGIVATFNRTGDDGKIVSYCQSGTEEGSMDVSGTTVSLTGAHLGRKSQRPNNDRDPSIIRGTVLTMVDEMCEWFVEEYEAEEEDEGKIKRVKRRNIRDPDDTPIGRPQQRGARKEKIGQWREKGIDKELWRKENEQLTKADISSTASDRNVTGIFDRWSDGNDMLIANTGDFVVRMSTAVQMGDLLESAGDGTARPQADQDFVRRSTLGRATLSWSPTPREPETLVPCLLMIS